jgi:hypothetical protein
MTGPKLLVLLALSLCLACGGGAAPGPKPLRHHYDEVYIAQLSMEAKSNVLKSQNDFQRARAEQMKAESDFSESKTKLGVSKNERKQAKLSEQSAGQEKQAADASGDMTRINRAARDLRVAEVARRAADGKVSYLKSWRKYLKRLVRYSKEETLHREARYEHEKAKLGQANNIAPKGVRYENFPGQTEDRSRRSQKARQKSQQDKQKSDEAKKTWQALVKEAERAKGAESSDSNKSSSGSSTDSSTGN